MSRLPDLRELVNREFFDLWLAKISEISEKLPSSVDPQMASFTCQLAVAACLKEAGLSSGSREADLDFGMELVRTLWAITPMGAKSRIRPEVLEAMTPVSWRDPISAWHNFRAAGLGAAFIASIKDLYKENYPLLTDEDAGVLAQLSPTVRKARAKTSTLAVLEKMSYTFLDAFHSAQISHYLGELPHLASDSELAPLLDRMPPNEYVSAFMLINAARMSSIALAHLDRSASPPNIRHQELFPLLISRDEHLAQEWSRLVEWAASNGRGQAELLENALDCTFLFSYEAAHQLFTCDRFIHTPTGKVLETQGNTNVPISAELNSLEVGSIAEYLFLVDCHYRLALPNLTEPERAELKCRNPSFIYLELASLLAGPAEEGKMGLDDQDDLVSQLRAYLRTSFQHNFDPQPKRIFADSKFTFYGRELAELRNMGDYFGVIAHEIGHAIDETRPEGAHEIVDWIVAEFHVPLTPEDYARFGEEELMADLCALSFHAKIGSDQRNDLVFEYARLRHLPERLYRPFMQDDLPEPGLSLDHAIAIDQLPEEYEFVFARRCPRCASEFDRRSIERRSNIVYRRRIHDILRLRCGSCGEQQDFFFDYTRTLPISPRMREAHVEQIASVFGEVTDPLPADIFTWHPSR